MRAAIRVAPPARYEASWARRLPSAAEEAVVAIVANRYWILLALAAAAIVSYGVGFTPGLGLFIAAGAIFELAFWLQLFRRRRHR